MQFNYITFLLAALAAASPVYQIEIITLTKYTTIVAGHAEYTSAFPQSSKSAISASSVISEETQITESPAAPSLEVKAAAPAPENQTSSSSESSIETSSTSSAETFSGEGTYYDTGLGACGWTSKDTDYIVAIGRGLFDQHTPNGNPNNNALCGRKIIAHHEGKSVEVTVVDRCEGCKDHDLDFSPAAFETIIDKSLGRTQITWEWA